MAKSLLTLNTGSSSLKFVLYALRNEAPEPSCKGEIEGIGTQPHFIVCDPDGATLDERRWPGGDTTTNDALLAYLLDWIDHHLAGDSLAACGHRIVHGGPKYVEPVRITAKIIADLESFAPLAPLHQLQGLAAVRSVQAARPDLAQVACFDTAFHHGMAPVVSRIALPRSWEETGIRRYGFHGLSYEYVAGRLAVVSPRLATGRTIIAHLGNGASLCALKAGRSADTTMGLTPLDGLVMGTRCGAIDPGVVLYFMQHHGLSASRIEDILYHRSGLLGISGISSDMRTLLASKETAAGEAIDSFVFHILRETGALAATLKGIDGFVFTGGIGERAPVIRQLVCSGLGWLGIELDEAANQRGVGRISTENSAIEVWVIATDEELVIARHTIRTLYLSPGAID